MDLEVTTKLLSLGCLSLLLGIAYELKRKESHDLKKKLSLFSANYIRHHGFHEWFGLYDIESFDGGKMWYALSSLSDGRRVVLGEAEQIHPGILSELCIFSYLVSWPETSHNFIPEKSTNGQRVTTNLALTEKQSNNDGLIYQDLKRNKRRHNQSVCMKLPKIEAS